MVHAQFSLEVVDPQDLAMWQAMTRPSQDGKESPQNKSAQLQQREPREGEPVVVQPKEQESF